MFPMKPFPGLRHISYEGSFFSLLYALGQRLSGSLLQCLSENLSLVRPETGTGEVVVGLLGSACLQLNQTL